MRAVAPILPTEPDVTITSSISPLPEAWHADAFSHGLTFLRGVECAVPDGWPTCQEDAAADKGADTIDGDVGFKSFIALYAIECEDGSTSPQGEQRRAAIARASFDAIKHQIIAGQLWWNQVNPTEDPNANGVLVNPSLKDVATVLGDPTTAADPISVIARLVAARRELSGSGTVLIHGPLVFVPYLISQGTITKVGGRYEGPGFTFVTDEGYPDDAGADAGVTAGPLDPDDDPNYFADVEGETWLYASGRVEYAWGRYLNKANLGAEQDNSGQFSPYTTWRHRTNDVYIVVEQEAFLRFDPCSILAAKAYIPTIAQGEGT